MKDLFTNEEGISYEIEQKVVDKIFSIFNASKVGKAALGRR